MGAPCIPPLHQSITEAYQRLTHDQLVLFLTIRSLSSYGTDYELAQRLADWDIARFVLPQPQPAASSSQASIVLASAQCSAVHRSEERKHPTLASKPPPRHISELPVEIVADIVDHLNDWELAKALGLPTSLKRPAEWNPDLKRVSQTDWAILTSPLSVVQAVCDADIRGPTKRGTSLAVRFARVKVLHHILRARPDLFHRDFGMRADLVPTLASLHGRVDVLEWWHTCPDIPVKAYDCEPMDAASREGHVHVLQWWKDSGLALTYSEAALEHASAQGHIGVLDWWKLSGLHLKVGRVLDMASGAGRTDALEWWKQSGHELKYGASALAHASTAGRVDVLEWWSRSGLQMLFDPDVLTGATKHNRTAVLDWWDRSGLPIQYRICDIEEALEDAIGPAEDVRRWWKRKGLNVNANDAEWVKLQMLNGTVR